MKEPFLQACGRWYDAKVIQAPFDAFTPSAVNDWVSRNTDGMIERIVDEADPLSVMLLVNAAAFKGTWLEPYEEGQVEAGTFHSASGTADEAQLMRSSEELYLEGPGCTGFLKPYDDGRFAFAALLPEEGSTPEQLLASLDGPSLRALLKGASYDAVDAWLPKFETSYGAQLRSVLGDLGMVDAFDPSTADFSGIGSGSLYVGDVAHKAFIRHQADQRPGAHRAQGGAPGQALRLPHRRQPAERARVRRRHGWGPAGVLRSGLGQPGEPAARDSRACLWGRPGLRGHRVLCALASGYGACAVARRSQT